MKKLIVILVFLPSVVLTQQTTLKLRNLYVDSLRSLTPAQTIYIQDSVTLNGLIFQTQSTGTNTFAAPTSFGNAVTGGGGAKILITGAGQQFEAYGSTYAGLGLYVTGHSGYFDLESSTGNMRFGIDAGTRMTLSPSGLLSALAEVRAQNPSGTIKMFPASAGGKIIAADASDVGYGPMALEATLFTMNNPLTVTGTVTLSGANRIVRFPDDNAIYRSINSGGHYFQLENGSAAPINAGAGTFGGAVTISNTGPTLNFTNTTVGENDYQILATTSTLFFKNVDADGVWRFRNSDNTDALILSSVSAVFEGAGTFGAQLSVTVSGKEGIFTGDQLYRNVTNDLIAVYGGSNATTWIKLYGDAHATLANTLALGTSSTNALTIDASRNITASGKITSTASGWALDISPASGNALASIRRAATTDFAILTFSSAGEDKWQTGLMNDATQSYVLRWAPTATPMLTLSSAGNLSVVGTVSGSNLSGTNTGDFTLNGLTSQTQTFATGTSGTDVNWASVTSTHTLNIPDASATARGLVTTGVQSFAGAKTFNADLLANTNFTVNGNSNLSGGVGDVVQIGATIVSGFATASFFNTTTTNASAFGAATTLSMGATSGTFTLNNPSVVGSQATVNLWDATSTTVHAFGAATAIDIGATTGTLTLDNPTIVGSQTTVNLWNTTSTTVNAFGASTATSLGASTGWTKTNNDFGVGITPAAQFHVKVETEGAELARLETTAGAGLTNGSMVQEFMDSDTTQDNIARTVFSYATSADETYYVETRIVGHNTSAGLAQAWHKSASFNNVGGGLTQTGTTTTIADHSTAGSIAFSTSGNNIIINITGTDGVTYKWAINTRIVRVRQ